MQPFRLFLLTAVTATLSVGGTLLIRDIISEEPPVSGAAGHLVESAVLGESRPYLVHLPEGYDTDTAARYPILYVLDGASQMSHTVESAALLARIGVAPPMIVVGVPSVNGDTRHRDYTPPDMRLDTDAASSPMGAADRFLTFLSAELIPQVEREYRASRPRMLAGWSRGGLFVMYAGLASTALFDGRFAHSPALWRDDSRIIAQLESVLRQDSVGPGFLYLSLGSRESDKMSAAFDHAAAVLAEGAPATLRWRADRSAGGEHDTNPRLATPVGLCAMFADSTGRACRGAGVTSVLR